MLTNGATTASVNKICLVPGQVGRISKCPALLVQVVAAEEDDCSQKCQAPNDQVDYAQSIVAASNPGIGTEHQRLQ